MTSRDHARGVILGLACGDAVGRPVEGEGPDDIKERYGTVTSMLGGGVFSASRGTTTDDTALALCLAKSVIDQGGFDPDEFVDQLITWYETNSFGIGQTTKSSVQRLQKGEPWHKVGPAVWRESMEGYNAGNGSVMRCAPLALAYDGLRNNSSTLDMASMAQSFVTHADPRCVYGCILLNRTIVSLLGGSDTPLSDALDTIAEDAPSELVTSLRTVPTVPSEERFGLTPYVVDSLEIALHHGLTASSTADGIIGAVNEGGDTDTTGAIAGAVAGARHGVSSLPPKWLEILDNVDELYSVADTLWTGDFAPIHKDEFPTMNVVQ